MDMQNVSNLQIPEGAVRTIHDKDSRLIWGRLAYDTKYAGDTKQQTYSGKNLFNTQNLLTNWRTTIVSSDNNNLVLKPNVNGSGYLTYTINAKPSTTYTISLDRSVIGSADGFVGNIAIYRFNGTDQNTIGSVPISTNTFTFTTASDTNELRFLFYSLQTSDETWSDVVASYTNIQVEESNEKTSYEPYTGGIPAPNPDYPQAVQVVTGEQTVTIGDGVDSEDFTISLGSTELCKIGNYQDYIYKSGDDWYVHKECGKAVFDGTESWSGGTSTGSPTYLYAYTAALDSSSLYSVRQAFCSHFSIWPNQLAAGTSVTYPCMSVVTPSAVTYAHIRLMIPLTIAGNITGLKTWLGSHNTNLYYVLATATDTQITDATLIGQLNAIHEWMTRYGYNSVVTGNLPIIIDRTNL